MTEYIHDIEVTVELEEREPIILIDLDGALTDLTIEHAETFYDMLGRAIDTARSACTCGDDE